MKNKFSINKYYLILGIIGLLVVGGFIGYNYQNSQNEVSATGGSVNPYYTERARGITASGIKITGMQYAELRLNGGTCYQYAQAKRYQEIFTNLYIERNAYTSYMRLVANTQTPPDSQILKLLARYKFIACISLNTALVGDISNLYVSSVISGAPIGDSEDYSTGPHIQF